jgi:adenine-specific DNA-methyltransferase
MMRERLKLARQLLSESGVIFISIDDNEQAYLKVLCDEIFGEEEFVANLVWQKKSSGGQHSKQFLGFHEYILCYTKNTESVGKFLLEKNEEQLESFTLEDEYLEERGRYLLSPLKSWLDYRQTLIYPIECPDGSIIETQWVCAQDTFLTLKDEDRIEFKKNKDGQWSVHKKQYEYDRDGLVKPASIYRDSQSVHGTKELKNLFSCKSAFPNPKPVSLIKHLLKISSKPNSTILDFFAGSGTTGQAVMELNEEDGGNRQCILVANNENNIGWGVMFERIYRVVNGVGTNGEEFAWEYKKEQKCLENNIWDIFEIETHELKIDDFEKAMWLVKEADLEFRSLNENYESKDLDIHNQLASLNPYKK